MDQALAAIAQQLGPAGEGAVLCHSGALRAFLCKITVTPYRENRRWKLPHGSVTILEHSPGGWQLLGAGLPPDQRPDDGAIAGLWETYGAGDRAQRHCRVVAEKAASLCRGLAAGGLVLDEDLVRRAALLHDLLRQEPCHARAGARLLRRLGYFRVAAVWWPPTRTPTARPGWMRRDSSTWRISWSRRTGRWGSKRALPPVS